MLFPFHGHMHWLKHPKAQEEVNDYKLVLAHTGLS